MSPRTYFVIEALLVAVNLLGIALGGSMWNWIVAIGLTVCAVYDFRKWRDQVDTASAKETA